MKKYRERKQQAFIDQCFREMKEKAADSLEFAKATRIIDSALPEFNLADQIGTHMGWALRGEATGKFDYLSRFLRFMEFAQNTRALTIFMNKLAIANDTLMIKASNIEIEAIHDRDRPVNMGNIVKPYAEAKHEKEKGFAFDYGFGEGAQKALSNYHFDKVGEALGSFLKGLDYVEAAYRLKGARHGWVTPETPEGETYMVYPEKTTAPDTPVHTESQHVDVKEVGEYKYGWKSGEPLTKKKERKSQ